MDQQRAATNAAIDFHIFGYDSVKPIDDERWNIDYLDEAPDKADQPVWGEIDLIKTEVTAANEDRKTYIGQVLQRRLDRLFEIDADNLVKIASPFELQLRLLEQESADVADAKYYAMAAAWEYFTDIIGFDAYADTENMINGPDGDPAETVNPTLDDRLAAYVTNKLDDVEGRMKRYYDDKVEHLTNEKNAVVATLNRAFAEGKPVDEVFYAMRIDWLQGVYISG